ncbi:MAG: phosphatidylserine decarboxylase [Gammaproteobacteria bacterium]|nr:phosphatidylserine decarboxylase [Gammaproteobacteria bacterium]
MPDIQTPSVSAPLSDYFRNLPQYLLPQRWSTRLVYWATRIRAPWFKNRLIHRFIQHFQVDLREALEPNPHAYPDFNAFFTRALKPGVRPIAPGDRVMCCPVDGAVSQIGLADADTLLQAKGRTFSLTTLLGGDAERAQPFQGGAFATLYLSPRDYHRIHMPLTGQLREMVHIPGKLFSVSPLTTRMVPNLFARNERVVTWFDTPAGPLALVLVGAINVASIETVWAGAITPPLGASIRHWRYPAEGDGAVRLDKGAELGRFNMGSTVILLFGPGAVRWESAIQAGATVRMGQRLGKIEKRAYSLTMRSTR